MVNHTQSKNKIGIIVATSLILAITIFSIYRALSAKIINQQEKSSPINPSEVTHHQTVTAIGRIEPKNKIIKLSGPSHLFNGRIIKVLVQEGEKVKQGQIIAILDNFHKQQAVLEVAQQRVKVAQAQLKQVMKGEAKQGEIAAQEAEITYLEAQFQGEVATQKAKIARLEAELLRQQDIEVAEIERLKAELDHAAKECKRYDKLFEDGAVNTSTRDSKCLEAKTFQEQLKETQADKNRIVETLQEEINEARATLNQILSTFPSQITQAKATLNQLKEIRSVDVQVAQAELSEAIASVTEAKADLELAYVKAPVDGQILKIHTFAGERIGNEGIVDLGQTEQMYVVAEVYESDIEQIQIGQAAIISSSALPIKFTGIVEQIGLQVGKKDVFNTDPTLDIDARVFEVKIHLDSSHSEQAAGLINLQVEVEINTKSG